MKPKEKENPTQRDAIDDLIERSGFGWSVVLVYWFFSFKKRVVVGGWMGGWVGRWPPGAILSPTLSGLFCC